MPNRAVFQITEDVCKALKGTWDSTNNICTLGNTKLISNIEVYRGDPCQQSHDNTDRYILVPSTREIMAALKDAKNRGR